MRTFDAINKPTGNSGSSHPIISPPDIAPQRPKRRKLKWLILFLVIVAGLVWGGMTLVSKANKIFTNKENIFVRIGRLVVADDKPLIGEDKGTVNILLLGHGGPGHEGPNLTDTMMVASIDINTKEVVLISIPRDFMVTLPNLGLQKINAAYAYAERDEEGSGGEIAIQVAEQVTGLDIPYFAAVDFKGFVKAVDRVGGVDVVVDRTFTDSFYPNYNYGYLPPVTFTKGPEHMDGERALIFARSRKGNNGEASDFSRSERQKKIIVAMKEKALALNLTNVKTVNGLLNDFTENFRTNLEPYELERLAGIASGIDANKILSFSLEPENNIICDGLIDLATGKPPVPITPVQPETPEETAPAEDETATETPPPAPVYPSSTGYVVLPCFGKTLQDIHAYLTTAPILAKLKQEGAVIEVQNSTGKAAALTSWRQLAEQGLNVKITTFRGKTAYDRTVLYDNSKGAKPRTLEYIKSRQSFNVSDVPYYDSPTSDIVIILGTDSL